MQLVGLQRIFSELVQRDIALVGVSYDPVSKLKRFADGWGIEFPMLSDEGSEHLRELGMVDVDLAEHQAEWGLVARDEQWGVAYPGVFVLDEHGTVVEKHFEQNYRERRTAETLMERALGVAVATRGPEVALPDGPVRARVSLDSPTYSWFARLRLRTEIDVAPGWHLYDKSGPPEMQPLDVQVDVGDGVLVECVSEPVPTEPWEGALAHVGSILVEHDLIFRTDRGEGEKTVRVEVSFQACSETTCLPPSRSVLEVTVGEVVDPLD